MSQAALFEKSAGTYVLSVGPVMAIRSSIAKRTLVSIVFFAILVGGILIFIATLNWISALLTFLFALAAGIWGQYWRDVDSVARQFLHIAVTEIHHEMKHQGIDPSDKEQRTRFNPSNLASFQKRQWETYQEFAEADDVQQIVGRLPT